MKVNKILIGGKVKCALEALWRSKARSADSETSSLQQPKCETTLSVIPTSNGSQSQLMNSNTFLKSISNLTSQRNETIVTKWYHQTANGYNKNGCQ